MSAAISLIVTVPVTDLLEKPGGGKEIGAGESQLLFGERFLVESEEKDWVYGESEVDGYRGYVRKDCLDARTGPATHFISSLSALVYPQPAFKTRPILNLSFLSRVTATATGNQRSEGFLWCEGTGWIPEQHVLPLSAFYTPVDLLETAMMFIHAPYRYGGRLAWGIDCSGLVQISLLRNGIRCPRDSSQQCTIGQPIDLNEVQRGDLIFFRDHVGIMADNQHILNASARTMSVTLEPLVALERVYKGITAMRRAF